MAVQSVQRRRCLTCNRWGGQRRPGDEPDTVEFDEAHDRGPCQDGPWHGTLRGPRNACGQWLRWTLIVPAPDPAEAPAQASPPHEQP
ncbi:MAG TPA: hypothetical protein PLN96_03695 [Zoogloea sp.]|uniref:hypothetical protein n=1 Tax=Zoogloea sp. TaxID=49181 RepID=UPI002C48BF39|nr:hypothetical protein [Zoogloea sp.]HMV19166.1 hypothetical protein [Rhodocyclaceae bacterium]HMV63164.1 hypothetical protein [Rhodocyclaceae bacterium]HMZ76093.1 hypothetical protein [Rhodocyclaceae bacterium]HNB64139.1 hypothetical protein [Rhodocyclaceae bacterium]HNF61316.1 hypothetical protein [Rhodocyclaceae bacterium]